jgi:hypothetical protein
VFGDGDGVEAVGAGTRGEEAVRAMNQALYDSTFTRLYEDGMSELLACLAAYILATDDLRDRRTVEQDAIARAAEL